MKRVLGNCVGAAFACSVLVLALQVPATAETAAKIAEQAQKGAVVPDEGVYQIYQNHSWMWGNHGAAFFAVRQRQFNAWSTEKGQPGYGDGTWFIPGGGKLCYRAQWHGAWGVKGSMTCFEHRQTGKAIYKRKSPDGEWYVFRSPHRNRSDEFMKLKYGDYVTRKQSRIKARL
ncbi:MULTISPECIES: DUF995 domain-containing protein [unclassified Mesorhizobium]|uniref:DUF995 domain-containing protein n=1 Tax=unclassified Mesorhizobium TaxID=325217 RepID=UPI000FD36CBD|nr:MULTISPECIES: DUF995 domain-containing protein [unclassified Mesorhizobium]RVD47182.1 DUF995 domain-containing protein [Mesorhizobium sp. M8A.F.Ca.ET.023.02.2.1]TGR58691.1 DUF995 domain-containing protein [bacterium M00.F.Ca.ET.199.01.1.1]TGU41200.1 DUF995 domain-containing protein [bacterium M00.F.Ca.ET.156.01.1.1]TGU91891.1 DUF995 domain-containing protein [Mesorhizobium sp. M00.F.Ca.ET.151.01.1.1]TGV10507.1 DUF995 domain-containing protein [Mesorhizobium sp. M8A.F.Ca.ET.173.01.1.1]TGV53